ncbi:MAG TPA: hypothetical protein PLQ89_22425 [Phycisphaerae bacterium]|nr:hypothetical protein [Phycisphaerae bacterium]
MKVQITAGAAVVLLLLCLVLMCAGCGIDGVHSAKPVTRVQAGPYFKLENSKDVSVSLDEGSYDPATKAVTIKGLELEDNASDVREANYLQMRGMAMQAEANWDGATGFLREAGSFVRETLPIFGAKAAWTIGSFFGTALLVIGAIAIGLPILTIMLVVIAVASVVLVRKILAWGKKQ